MDPSASPSTPRSSHKRPIEETNLTPNTEKRTREGSNLSRGGKRGQHTPKSSDEHNFEPIFYNPSTIQSSRNRPTISPTGSPRPVNRSRGSSLPPSPSFRIDHHSSLPPIPLSPIPAETPLHTTPSLIAPPIVSPTFIPPSLLHHSSTSQSSIAPPPSHRNTPLPPSSPPTIGPASINQPLLYQPVGNQVIPPPAPSSPPLVPSSSGSNPPRRRSISSNTRSSTSRPERNSLRRQASLGQVSSSPDKHAVDMRHATPIERMKYVLSSSVNAGFDKLEDLIIELLKVDYIGRTASGRQESVHSNTCAAAQYAFWHQGLPAILAEVQRISEKRTRPIADLVPVNGAVMGYATHLLRSEFVKFAGRTDNRGWNKETNRHNRQSEETDPDRGYKPSYLLLKTEDVTAEVIAGDILGDSINEFKSKVPFLWELLTNITYNASHDYRLKNLPEEEKQELRHERQHITASIVHQMSYKYSIALRRWQTQVGLALLAAGCKEKVITILQQYGISIGVGALDKVNGVLAEEQRKKRLQWGRRIASSPLLIYYDNINIMERAGQQRIDNSDHQYNGMCGSIIKQLGHPTMLKENSFESVKVDYSPNCSVLFDNAIAIAQYDEILQKRHIKFVLNKRFFDELKINPAFKEYQSRAKADAAHTSTRVRTTGRPSRTRKTLSDHTEIRTFDSKDGETNCPQPSEVLPIQPYEEFLARRLVLPLYEGEEMSHEGTASYLRHILKDQLHLEEKDVEEVKIIAMGDLGTRKTIGATQILLQEDQSRLENLKAFWPAIGPFHLQKCLLEMILKLGQQSGCHDFAHFDAIIKSQDLKGFIDGKCAHYKRMEDLVLTFYDAHVMAYVLQKIPSDNPRAREDEKVLFAAERMTRDGLERTVQDIVDPLYTDVINPYQRWDRTMDAQADGKGDVKISQRDQVGQLLGIIGVFLELKEAIKYGLIGKFPALFERMLPFFAGSSARLYTRELASLVLLQRIAEPETYWTVIKSMLVPARGGRFIAVDMQNEQEVRVNKSIWKSRGGAFNWKVLMRNTSVNAPVLHDAFQQFRFGHLDEKNGGRGRHYNPSLSASILDAVGNIEKDRIYYDPPPLQTCEHADWERMGTEKLATYDMDMVYRYMFSLDDVALDEDADDVALVEQVRAIDEDPDTGIVDNQENEDVSLAARYLQQARERIMEETGRGGINAG